VLKYGGALAASWSALPLLKAGAASQLEWWNPHGSPAFMAEWDKLLPAFASKSGVEVTNSIVGWGDLVPRLTQGGTSGSLPGVATGGSGYPQIFAKQGILADVSDVIAKITAGGSKFTDKALLACSYQGKPYGVPRYTATNGITFRADLFEAAGVTPPDPTGSKYAFSWEEFADACARLTKGSDQYAFAAAGTTFDAEKVIWNFLATNEAYILDKDGKLDWENQKTVDTYRFVADLYRKYAPPGVATYDLAAASQAFLSGKVAMTYGDGDVQADIDTSNPDWVPHIGFMPSPVKTTKVGYGGSVCYMLPEGDQLADAKAFVEYMLQPDNLAQAVYPFRILVVPATDAAQNSEILKSDATVQKWSKVLAQMAAVTANATGVAQYFAASPEAGLIESSGILSKTLQKILVNNVDPEKAVAEATPELQQLLSNQ
jgi:ABC-type glycerol-3-phosphate transport system substrate-binding protein